MSAANEWDIKLNTRRDIPYLQATGRSVWENLGRGRKDRPNAVRSVHTTEVKILPVEQRINSEV